MLGSRLQTCQPFREEWSVGFLIASASTDAVDFVLGSALVLKTAAVESDS